MLTGLPVEQFLELFSQIEAVSKEYEKKRHSKSNRKRAVGGGRKCNTPLVVRVVMVLMYIRFYTTQEVVASIFGKRKWDVCRDLRRLLPLITAQLPTPELINPVKEKGSQGVCIKTLEELLELYSDTIAILDATEQPVEKSKGKDEGKHHYSGKNKLKGGELSEEEKEKNKQIGKVRVIVEHVIGWMKNFLFFSHVY